MSDKPQQPPEPAPLGDVEKTAAADPPVGQGVPSPPEQTLDDAATPTPQQYLDKTRRDSAGPVSATPLGDFARADTLPEDLLTSQAARRFMLGAEVGKGGAGLVYALRDNGLGRVIAVKFLQKEREQRPGVRSQFIHEARVTAMLEHPSIMPVYDIGVTQTGQVFFTMKKITGATLGDAIRCCREGKPGPEEFRSIDGRVRIFLKVCDALTYAHHQKFIHQDIKPDNIMLGEFGEALVLDWGSARSADEPPIEHQTPVGTPAYMSPEQARREPADEQSDVYSLGATFFHALLLRHACWADDAETFWQRKRSGSLDLPTDQERRGVPAALLDIALKALSPEPAERYQSVAAFADDLKRWQAGRAVVAHRETVFEAFGRWYRRNQRVFWIAFSSVVLLSAVSGLFFREKIQELLTWRGFYADNFSGYGRSADLGRTWQAWVSANWQDVSAEPFSDSGCWRIEQADLHGHGSADGFNNITFGRAVPGDMRVEWTATALRENRDLNAYIAGETRSGGYTFHIGGFGSPRACVLTKGAHAQILDRCDLDRGLEVNTPYRLRMEKEGAHLRLYMDGVKVIDYSDIDDLSGPGHQTFGFEVNQGNVISIDNVQVYYHPLPLKVSPLAAADQFAGRGFVREALAQYRDIAAVYTGHDIAAVARFKAARCLMQLDSTAQALQAFAQFEREYPRHELVPLVRYERVRVCRMRGDLLTADSCLRELGRRFPGHVVLRTALFDMTDRYAAELRAASSAWLADSGADMSVPRRIAERGRELQAWGRALGVALDDNEFLSLACQTLYTMHWYSVQQAIDSFPEQRAAHAKLLLARGQYERVCTQYPEQSARAADALCRMGRYSEALRRYPRERDFCAAALVKLGKLDQVLLQYPGCAAPCADALWGLGRAAESVRTYPLISANRVSTLGMQREMLERLGSTPLALAALLTWGMGRPDSTLAVLDHGDPRGDLQYHIACSQALQALGRTTEIIQRYGALVGMEGSCTEALIALGRTDEALARYSHTPYLHALALIAAGEYDSVLQRCAQEGAVLPRVLWQAGRFEHMLKTYSERPDLCARVLLAQGRYAEVLARYQDQREQCAKALYCLGRYAEVIGRYPEQREICCLALLKQGGEAHAMKDYPESRYAYANYLLDQGRFAAVVDSFADQVAPYSMALLRLGRPAEIPVDHGLIRLPASTAYDVQTVAALMHLAAGRRAIADSLLRSRRWLDYYSWGGQRFSGFLLGPVLKGLAGDTLAMKTACAATMREHRREFGQRLWYEAAYLSGAVSDSQFLAQPYGWMAAQRLALYRAILCDVRGQRGGALAGYRSVADDVRCQRPGLFLLEDAATLRDIFESGALWEFVTWRILTLGPIELGS